MLKRFALVLAVLGAFCVAGFSQESAAPTPVPGPAALVGLPAESLMALMNRWGMSSEANAPTVWTTSRALHFLFADGTRRDIALSDDRMVVSIAPYIMKTHPCRDHTPSSCPGELAEVPVKVTAVTADGRTVLSFEGRTQPNGFVDLWLPRGEQIDVTVVAREMSATGRVGTGDSDITCITTLKLRP